MHVLAAGDTAGENSLAAEASLSEPTLSSAWRLSTRPCSTPHNGAKVKALCTDKWQWGTSFNKPSNPVRTVLAQSCLSVPRLPGRTHRYYGRKNIRVGLTAGVAAHLG